MSRLIVSQLWIARAERALDTELQGVSQDSVAEVRAHLRVAAHHGRGPAEHRGPARVARRE